MNFDFIHMILRFIVLIRCPHLLKSSSINFVETVSRYNLRYVQLRYELYVFGDNMTN